jgi:hypothetical protein
MHDEQEIGECYNKLELVITGISSEIVHAIDEIGFDSWVGASRMAIVVRTGSAENEITLPAARHNSRTSMIPCVAANGRSLRPSIAIM